jgi:hypothetical protein
MCFKLQIEREMEECTRVHLLEIVCPQTEMRTHFTPTTEGFLFTCFAWSWRQVKSRRYHEYFSLGWWTVSIISVVTWPASLLFCESKYWWQEHEVCCLKKSWGVNWVWRMDGICGKFTLTLSDLTSDLIRHYDFPVPLRCRKTSHVFSLHPLRCRSVSDAFPRVVQTLANR